MIVRRTAAVLLAPLLLLCAAPAVGQANPAAPAAVEGVGVDEKLDEQIPLDLQFTDENGRRVRLGDYFSEGRPVLLTLVYYDCPMLCTLVLDGMVDTLQGLELSGGDQFEMVTVSIDPGEQPHLARAKKQSYVREYGRAEAAAGWHFLTGEQDQIRRLADAVGFRYRYLPERGEYAHPAALIVLTPEGRVSRYLFGVNNDPKTMRLALVEASEGKIGSIVDQFLLYCYRYDAEEGTYAPAALKIMRVGAILAAIVLGAVLVTFWRRDGDEGSA